MKKSLKFLFPVIILLLAGCAKTEPDARQIVDAANAAHGGDGYANATIDFDFRGRHYQSVRNGGEFRYSRAFADSTGEVLDVLDNSGFTRSVNGEIIALSATDSSRFANALNSVIYFALLPFPLQDAAVQPKKLADETINEQPYHTIEVTFQQSGGGKDFDDVFIYWFHRERNTMDYLAYKFYTDGGGIRFREAFNSRVVGGIRIADFHNFKPQNPDLPVQETAAAFQKNELTKLSEIVLENLSVSKN